MAYQNPDGSYDNELGRLPIQVAAPSTGATVAVSSGSRRLYINNSGTLAALTIKLPPSPELWQDIVVSAKAAVTSLSWVDSNGTTVSGLSGALAANTPTMAVFGQMVVTGAKAWFRWS